MTIKLSSIIKNISEVIPEFASFPLVKRSWLINMYAKSYANGVKAIALDTYENPEYLTTQALMDRIKEYPETSVNDTEFMRALAKGDEASLNLVLDENDEQEDFVYQIYEENYSDWSEKAAKKVLKEVPPDLTDFDLDLLAQESFSQGIFWKTDRLAKKAITDYAKKILKETEG
jgi:hypothetical protein